MPPALFTDDLSFGGNMSGLLDNSADALEAFNLPTTANGDPPTSPAKANLSRATKARPSWGPPPTAGTHQGLRLLDGLPAAPQWPPNQVQDQADSSSLSTSQPIASHSGGGAATSGSKVRLGGIEHGKGKPRFSLFAKPAYAPAKRLNNPTSTSTAPAAPAALPPLPDDVPSLAMSSSQDDLDSATDTPSSGQSLVPLPTKEEYAIEIKQLKALNDVFSNYDLMLQGTAEHIDVVASRVHDINKLLDIYIDFLRRSQQIHSLLVDPTWQGISEEGALHDEAIAAAAQAAAKRQAEAEAKQREEEERRAAAAEAARQREIATSRSGTRRAGTRGAPSGRVPSGGRTAAARTGSAAGTGVTRSSSLRSASARGRGGPPPSRSVGTSSGSSGSSTAGIGNRPSGIPRPSSAGARSYGNVPSSGYGRR